MTCPRRCGTSRGSDPKMALRLFFIVPQQRTILLKSAAAKKYGLKKDHRNAVRGGGGNRIAAAGAGERKKGDAAQLFICGTQRKNKARSAPRRFMMAPRM